MLEVEMKFRITTFASIEERLRSWDAKLRIARQDADHYLNAPDRDFAKTDEALRLRRIGQANYLTYKGPKRDAQTKTRSELEVPLPEGDAAAEQFLQLFQYLGYRLVRVVQKQRRIFHLCRDGYDLEVCLDELPELGCFVELEIQAPEEALDSARAVLLQTATELGLANSERRSYLELLLAAETTQVRT